MNVVYYQARCGCRWRSTWCRSPLEASEQAEDHARYLNHDGYRCEIYRTTLGERPVLEAVYA